MASYIFLIQDCCERNKCQTPVWWHSENPPLATNRITAFVAYPSKWNTKGTVTSLDNFTETARLLYSHSMSTIFDKKSAISVTNTTASPHLIKRSTQIAEFFVVNPEHSEFIRPADTAILSLIPEGKADLTTYLNEIFRTNKLEQQWTAISFEHRKKLGIAEDHTPIQTPLLKELLEK